MCFSEAFLYIPVNKPTPIDFRDLGRGHTDFI